MSSDTSAMMTTKEVCAALDLHETTLSHWRRRGVGLRYIKLGSRYFYYRDEVERFGEKYFKGCPLYPIKWEKTK